MFFAIDHDTRTVLAVDRDSNAMETYLNKQDLFDAIGLVDSADELCLQFSLDEIIEICANTSGADASKFAFDDDEEAANHCWRILEDNGDQIPEFTKGKARKLFGTQTDESSDPAPAAKPAKTAKATRAPRKSKGVRANALKGMTFSATGKKPREGTSFCIFTDYLEENLDEATFDELVQAFKENYVPRNPDKPVDDALGRAYVRDAFNGGYIEEAL